MSRTQALKAPAVLLFIASLVLSLPLVAGMLARLHPAFDSFGHFRWHLSLAMIAVSLLLLFTRFRLQGMLAGVLGAAALWTTLPGMGFSSGTVAESAEPVAVYRLLQLNLRYNNPEISAVLSLIGRVKPDVITLNEVSTHWQPHLEKLGAMYPYRKVCSSTRWIGGVAMLSRRPIAPGQTIRCIEDGLLAIASISFGGRWIDIAALHLHWPWPFQQPEQIAGLIAPLESLSDSAILAGDLNAVTWSAAAGKIAEAGALTAVQGIGPTWLAPFLPQALIDYVGLPIDQVFAKGNVVLRSVERQEFVGSDHLPVLVEFSLANPGDEDEASVAMATNLRATASAP